MSIENISIEIRRYNDCDFSRLVEIHDQARPIELRDSCDERAFVPLAQDEKDLEDFIKSKKLVAVSNETVLGFIGFSVDEIGWLYVDPKAFGNKIASKLLEKALEDLPNKTSIYVLEGNIAARKLYDKYNFIELTSFESTNSGYPCRVIKMQNG